MVKPTRLGLHSFEGGSQVREHLDQRKWLRRLSSCLRVDINTSKVNLPNLKHILVAQLSNWQVAWFLHQFVLIQLLEHIYQGCESITNFNLKSVYYMNRLTVYGSKMKGFSSIKTIRLMCFCFSQNKMCSLWLDFFLCKINKYINKIKIINFYHALQKTPTKM